MVADYILVKRLKYKKCFWSLSYSDEVDVLTEVTLVKKHYSRKHIVGLCAVRSRDESSSSGHIPYLFNIYDILFSFTVPLVIETRVLVVVPAVYLG